MQYREMPKTGDKLSILGYGCMRLPTKARGKIDTDKALKQIRYAIDHGVNYIDTAWTYHHGASESFIGEYVLKDGYREKVKIATKLPCFLVRKPEDMDKFITKQLQRLQVETIDYYLLHAIDGATWKKMLDLGVIAFMDRIKSEGKVVNMGFSYHGSREDFREIIDGYDWDFTLVQYNILDENFQAGADGIDYAASKDIGVIVMEPLRGGTLVGKMPAEVQKIWDNAPLKRTPAEWALRWIWNNPKVHVVLSGMNMDEHIEENINIASNTVANSCTDEELAIVERVKETYHNLLSVGCTGCRYCIPCPVNIDIPYAFQTVNNYHMFGRRRSRKMMYLNVVGRGKEPRWTSMCIDCGKCEDKCPQNINIREEFKRVQKDIETPIAKRVIRLFTRLM